MAGIAAWREAVANEVAGDSQVLEELLERLRSAQVQLRKAKRQFRGQRKHCLEAEIREAWRVRRFRLVHSLSRQLADNEVKVKKRIIGQCRFTPSPQQLHDILISPALQGALQATIVDLKEQLVR